MRYFLIILFVLAGCGTKETKDEYTISRGVNISHWLSQSRTRGEDRAAFFTEKDVAFIAGIGYDHIRIPIDEEQMWDEEGNKETEAFQLLHNALNWCKSNGLRAIVDLHIIRSHHFISDSNTLWSDPEEQEKFIQLWIDLSDELKDYPVADVAYELMNEAVAEDPDDWNNLIARTIAVIREREPHRKIVVGSNMWQHVDTFHQLKIPDDPHIILSFHFYRPHIFTHYKAGWTDTKFYEGPVHYPGYTVLEEDITPELREYLERRPDRNIEFTIDTMREMFQEPLQMAKEKGLPLYCGEFGCYPTSPEADRLRWYSDMITVLEENGIAWANWDYKGGFGIVGRRDGKPYKELIRVLLGEEAVKEL